ncbi:hypothetical protein [Ottowia sp. SB7-C50]|uniref:hypothetical protein n=1 Tax=Ottowia sp. SB7-C50 TaxID=3081231 RepID=UPI002954651F|nr:hypothetical protein [Ottowia sp. SB7-C50]WOP15224.1 hypothetical protein R0D99_15635 [Ottowia sp. SB7-C50]
MQQKARQPLRRQLARRIQHAQRACHAHAHAGFARQRVGFTAVRAHAGLQAKKAASARQKRASRSTF